MTRLEHLLGLPMGYYPLGFLVVGLAVLFLRADDHNACGHVPPLILRTDGSIQRLRSTTTVLGLFPNWESPIEEEQLHPGDLLIIRTDGVTEAPNPHGEEYGDERLAEVIRENRGLPVSDLLAVIQASVQEFSGDTQADDITLIVARCR